MLSKRSLILTSLIVSFFVLYLARHILTPFIVAVAFAYVLNPLIKLIVKKTGMSRVLVVSLIFIIFVVTLILSSVWISSQIIREANLLTKEGNQVTAFQRETIDRLPEWTVAGQSIGLKTLVVGIVNALITTSERLKASVVPIVTGAFAYVVQLLIFLVAWFYFMKDGPKMIEYFKSFLPGHYHKEISEVGKKFNYVLGVYLRGQIFLVIIMSTVSTIVLTLLGVKFALLIGIASGFLELIPVLGPIVAGGLAAGTAFLTTDNNFGLDQTTLVLVIITFYFVARQIEDYFVIPQILGRMIKLHPLAVLFSVLAGGAIAGPMGFILGVPVAASGKLLFEYYWERSV